MEKKRVLVVYNKNDYESLESMAKLKQELHDTLKKNNFKVNSNSQGTVDLDLIAFHFFDTSSRNIKTLKEKYSTFPRIYVHDSCTGNATLYNSLISMAGNAKDVVVFNTIRGKVLFSDLQSLFDKTKVYVLNPTKTSVDRIEIWEYEFNPDNHYKVKKSAEAKLIDIVTSRIESNEVSINNLKKRVNDDRKILNKLQTSTK